MAMTRSIWITLVVVALIIGLVAGYAIWGHKASQVSELQAKVDQLTRENQDLKAKISQPTSESAQASLPEQKPEFQAESSPAATSPSQK